MRNWRPLLILLLALSAPAFAGDARADDPTPAHATTPATTGGEDFVGDRERGWHWYEDPPADPEPPKPEIPPPGTGTAAPPPFSVAWLKVEMERAKERAIDNPTRENVELYNYLQKIAMDKAEKFALMTRQVNTLNPALDETIDNPVTKYARRANEALQERQHTEVLTALAQDVGVIYFFKSDCPFCARQNPLLLSLGKKYGFSLLPVSLDQRPLNDGSFPNWLPDQGQGAQLGITSTPTLYLFKAPDKMVLLSIGLQTLPELERRILQVANGHGWLSQEDFERAMSGQVHDFLVDDAKAAEGVDWNDPQQALEALRLMSRRAIEASRVETSEDGSTFRATPWAGE